MKVGDKLSLTSRINGKMKRDKEFKEILLSIEPHKNDYYTLSEKPPFSIEYEMLVSNNDLSSYESSLVGTAFDYLARFRIAQFIKNEDALQWFVATQSFTKYKFNKDYEKLKLYTEWLETIQKYINDNSISITNILEIAIHFAKLEHLFRNGTKKENVDVNYVFFEQAPESVISNLENLMIVFEEKFMTPEILKKNSQVFFNPNFGVGSSLVSGADADIFIDGTLYDFKTTKSQLLNQKDSLQLVGYFLLNELQKDCGYLVGVNFDMNIERLAFYKARFGEVEYYDINKHFSLELGFREKKLKELAQYFKKNTGRIRSNYPFDYEDIINYLEQTSNFDVEGFIERVTKYRNEHLKK
ncbi:hypothetical protein ACERII_20260 [Evansella sp. AB-rgal1]|uniref:hypothetical protein n=1 Tax=Evansella sp. AB-rgal1 TaxID=3242696 RepID=UPI00359E3692